MFASPLRADTIELTNGDRLSAQIVSQNEQQVVIEHAVLGRLTVDRRQINTVVPDVVQHKGFAEKNDGDATTNEGDAASASKNALSVVTAE